MKITPLKMTLEIATGKIAGIVCCALEGGTGYWAKIEVVPGDAKPPAPGSWGDTFPDAHEFKHIWCALTPGAHIKVWDAESPDELLGTLDLEACMRGLALMQAKYPKHFADFLDETDDATTGDVFMQCAVLGEVTYG